MKFTTSVAALIASSSIAAALPEAVAGGTKSHLTSSCWTSSTCKASYYYDTKTESKPITVYATTTVYKPVTKTTDVPYAYTETKYSKFVMSPRPTNHFY